MKPEYSLPCSQNLVSDMKNLIFWDMTPCSPLSLNRRFGGTYRLQQAAESACHLLACWFSQILFLRPRKWMQYVPPKRRLKLNGLHGVISQKMVLLITTAVKISNPTLSEIRSSLSFQFPCNNSASISVSERHR
jgi:hypothetical protein